MLMNHVNSCHRNNAFFIVQLSLSCTTKNSLHFRGPNERFGTHEKLSWGASKVKLAPGSFYFFMNWTVLYTSTIQLILNLAFVAFYIRRCG